MKNGRIAEGRLQEAEWKRIPSSLKVKVQFGTRAEDTSRRMEAVRGILADPDFMRRFNEYEPKK